MQFKGGETVGATSINTDGDPWVVNGYEL